MGKLKCERGRSEYLQCQSNSASSLRNESESAAEKLRIGI